MKFREAQLDTEYHGLSASFTAQLFSAKLPMRIDFGFSDSIFPKPSNVDYPILLDFPQPNLKGYTPHTLIAEKFESIVRLGLANTRVKDFYDIWLITQQFPLAHIPHIAYFIFDLSLSNTKFDKIQGIFTNIPVNFPNSS